MSNGIHAEVMERGEQMKIVVSIFLDDEVHSWVEFDDAQFAHVLKVFRQQQKILRKAIASKPLAGDGLLQ